MKLISDSNASPEDKYRLYVRLSNLTADSSDMRGLGPLDIKRVNDVGAKMGEEKFDWTAVSATKIQIEEFFTRQLASLRAEGINNPITKDSLLSANSPERLQRMEKTEDLVLSFGPGSIGKLEGVVGGARNRAAHEIYKDSLRAAMERPAVKDAKLGQLMDQLYRPFAKVGSGSTADAVRKELLTGQPVGGVFHSTKASGMAQALQKWLSKNPTASAGDRAAAQNVIRDLQNALMEK